MLIHRVLIMMVSAASLEITSHRAPFQNMLNLHQQEDLWECNFMKGPVNS